MINVSFTPAKDLKDRERKEALLQEITSVQLELMDLYQKMLNPSEEVDCNHILKDGWFYTTESLISQLWKH